MTSEGLGEMFEGDSAEMCAGKFPLVSVGGRAEGLACADPGARTPIDTSGNFYCIVQPARHQVKPWTVVGLSIAQDKQVCNI